MVEDVLFRLYGLHAETVERAADGAGSDTFFVSCREGKYVLKYPAESPMNNPRLEPELCARLLGEGVSVSRFVKNLDGSYISADRGRLLHLQQFLDGRVYPVRTAPGWLLGDCARTLGRIHLALADYQGLPVGIGAEFFRCMTPESALCSYKRTLETAKARGDRQIARDLEYRIGLLSRLPKADFDLDALTCLPTHGDYMLSQLICGDDRINAVIDWTTACVHPVIWEIVRSYVYASPRCEGGSIDIGELTAYVADYLSVAPLKKRDIQLMGQLMFYQIAVCDYYNQYYQSAAANRHIYLEQAEFSTGLMRWFEENLDRLDRELQAAFY